MIRADRPLIGNLVKGGDGAGPGCRPGTQLDGTSITVNPVPDALGRVFVAKGTQVSLIGSARVRRWFPDCTSQVANGSIEWELTYQPVENPPQPSEDVTGWLQGSLTANSNSFVAAMPGVYNASFFVTMPIVSGGAGAVIYAGESYSLNGTAQFWIHSALPGVSDISITSNDVHGTLVVVDNQVIARLTPISQNGYTVSLTQGSGNFDLSSGGLAINAEINISGPHSGTASFPLSTDNTINPLSEGNKSGQRVDSSGHVVLVGEAPIVGPPGTTHGWLEISGTLTPTHE